MEAQWNCKTGDKHRWCDALSEYDFISEHRILEIYIYSELYAYRQKYLKYWKKLRVWSFLVEMVFRKQGNMGTKAVESCWKHVRLE